MNLKIAEEEPDFDLVPNRYELDEEWCNQPKIYHFYHDQLAEARRIHTKEEAKLEMLEAELKLEIRRTDAEVYGMEKMTEDSIKNLVTVNKRRSEQLQRIITAKHDVDVLSGMVKSLEQRKDGLQDLVKLFGQDYFAEPRVSKDTDNGVKERINFNKKKRIRNGGEGQ